MPDRAEAPASGDEADRVKPPDDAEPVKRRTTDNGASALCSPTAIVSNSLCRAALTVLLRL